MGLGIVLVLIQWLTNAVSTDNFVYEVPKLAEISFFESRYLYLGLNLFTFVPVFILSFDKRVAFYKQWKHLWRGMLLVAICFIVWDVSKSAMHVWGFNPRYLSGLYLYNLPIEEVLFFFTVPYATMFIYECLNVYFEKDLFKAVERPLTIILIVVFIIGGFVYWSKTYTATTFLITGFYLLYHMFKGRKKVRSRFYFAYLVGWLPFLLVDGALTGALQQEPVILYNPEEFLNLRIVSIPIEDSIYFIPLLLANVTLFERSRSKKAVRKKSSESLFAQAT